MLVLATVPVHETSLANQYFYSTLLGRGSACENAENYGWSLTQKTLSKTQLAHSKV